MHYAGMQGDLHVGICSPHQKFSQKQWNTNVVPMTLAGFRALTTDLVLSNKAQGPVPMTLEEGQPTRSRIRGPDRRDGFPAEGLSLGDDMVDSWGEAARARIAHAHIHICGCEAHLYSASQQLLTNCNTQ